MVGALLAKRKTLAAFDALNRHDLEALIRNYADNVIFVYPGEVGRMAFMKVSRPFGPC